MAKSSTLTLALNVLVTIYLGIQMPKKNDKSSKTVNSSFVTKWMSPTKFLSIFDRPRSANEPPFFFKEVRIGMLTTSILFLFGRLVYEGSVMDVSVILVAARLFLTALQLFDHWWFCKNWESFFLEKKMRAYIWFRLFLSLFLFQLPFALQGPFPPITRARWIIDAFQWIAGIQVTIWYYWGKHWNFTWGDMSDERRIPAIVRTMLTISLIHVILSIVLFLTRSLTSGLLLSEVLAVITYFLMALAFKYLNVVTIRSTEACSRILDETIHSKVGPDGHSQNLTSSENENSDGVHRQSTLTPFYRQQSKTASTRRLSNLMINIRQSLNESSKSAVSSGHGMLGHLEVTLDGPTENGDVGSASVSANNEFGVELNRVRIKPSTSLPNLNSIGSPLVPSLSDDHLMIDQMPLARQNSLEMNLTSYETAHLLSDKIMVVFVQVTILTQISSN